MKKTATLVNVIYLMLLLQFIGGLIIREYEWSEKMVYIAMLVFIGHCFAQSPKWRKR